jgi:hypothetical protein
MAKKTTENKSAKHMQKFDVRGVSKACLMRIEQYIRAECIMDEGRVIISQVAPSPPCGGPGDPC